MFSLVYLIAHYCIILTVDTILNCLFAFLYFKNNARIKVIGRVQQRLHALLLHSLVIQPSPDPAEFINLCCGNFLCFFNGLKSAVIKNTNADEYRVIAKLTQTKYDYSIFSIFRREML
jgi:hypothetical protein